MSDTSNIDKFGHCVICHKNLLTKRIVDGRQVDMFLPIYSDTMFLLNNGSQMQVTICTVCKETTDLSDPQVHSDIMDAVQKGWQLETQIKQESGDPEWTADKRDAYISNMSKLSIDCPSENLDKFVIQQRQIVLLNKIIEAVPEDVVVIDGNN